MNILQENFSITIFVFTIIITFLLIISKPLHIKFSQDTNSGPQKVHNLIIPRIGGVSMFIVVLLISILWKSNSFLIYLILSSMPIFFSGLLEDLTKAISAILRLIFTLISAMLCIFLIEHGINSLGFEIIDNFIKDTNIQYALAFLSITLLTQSYNIIDGLNGLCLLNAILVFLSLIYVSNELELSFFFQLGCFILSIFSGILFFNFPKPMIFMGDGGLIFDLISTIIIIFQKKMKFHLFCLSIIIYPIYETLRSFVRRSFISSYSFMKPDSLHLHSLIYIFISSKINIKQKWMNNSLASLISITFPMILCIWSCFNFNNRNFLILGIIIFLFIFEILMYSLKKYILKINLL